MLSRSGGAADRRPAPPRTIVAPAVRRQRPETPWASSRRSRRTPSSATSQQRERDRNSRICAPAIRETGRRRPCRRAPAWRMCQAEAVGLASAVPSRLASFTSVHLTVREKSVLRFVPRRSLGARSSQESYAGQHCAGVITTSGQRKARLTTRRWSNGGTAARRRPLNSVIPRACRAHAADRAGQRRPVQPTIGTRVVAATWEGAAVAPIVESGDEDSCRDTRAEVRRADERKQ